jgi:hypothetical protein
MNWTRRHATLAGLALIVLSNAVALGGAAYNRLGEPQGRLHLTERELVAPFNPGSRDSENSGLSLRLRWRSLPLPRTDHEEDDLYSENGGAPAWLDDGKMISLGFKALSPSERDAASLQSRVQQGLPREVLVVLELDGPASKESLRRATAFAKIL